MSKYKTNTRRFNLRFKIPNSLMRLLVLCMVISLASCASRSDNEHVRPALAQIKEESTVKDVKMNEQAKLHVSGDYVIPRPLPVSGVNSGYSETLIFAQNANVRIVNDIGFYVTSLVGRLTSNVKGEPVPLDDPQAFTLDILSGDVTLNNTGLGDIFNNHVFNYKGAPFINIKFTTRDNELNLKGEALRKGVYVPMDLTTRPRIHQDRYIILDMTDLKMRGESATELLKIGRISLDEMLTVNTPEVKLKGSAIWIDTAKLLPPPKINMLVESISADNNGLHLKFKTLANVASPKPLTNRDSYMIIRGGDMRLMRLLTLNAELNIVSKQEDEGLDFSFYDYRKQINEGFLSLLEDGRAVAFLENYKHLDK